MHTDTKQAIDTTMAAAQYAALVDIAAEIGLIPDLPDWATARITGAVSPVQDLREMTVGELVDLTRDARETMRARLHNVPAPELVICGDLACPDRHHCPHSQPHKETKECTHIDGVDEVCSRCFPITTSKGESS